MLLLPTGEPAGMMDPIILLMIWAEHLNAKLRAGIGRPTFPINQHVATYLAKYWSEMAHKTKAIAPLLKEDIDSPEIQQKIIDAELAIEYGEPQGDMPARNIMAGALSRWYDCKIKPEDILFTTGGLGGLYCVFEYLRRKSLHGCILTPFPHYPFYAVGNNLFPIQTMESPGYRLTADSVHASIAAAEHQVKIDHNPIRAFILCYPNNPMGTVLRKHEWEKIAVALRKVPDALIVLDEAYAELDFTSDGISLYTVAPDLRDRIVLMRSATKGMSAAGTRMAILVCQNQEIMTRLLEINSTISLHAVRDLQMAFAQAMDAYSQEDKNQLKAFYEPQLLFAMKRLTQLRIQLPDPHYQPEGSFYLMANLKELLGVPLSVRAQSAFVSPNNIIMTDEELVYSLLFDDGIMVTPGSYFGLDPTLGYVRITCSIGEKALGEIFDLIEKRLLISRA